MNYLGVVTGLEIEVEFGFGPLKKTNSIWVIKTGKKCACVYICVSRETERN